MNLRRFSPAALTTCLLLAALVAASGCRTAKVNWNERIGSYTYDQAVAEMGPPNRETTLDNGERVAEWVTEQVTTTSVTPAGGGYYGYGGWVAPGPVFASGFTTQYCLRLTFGPDGKLTAWKKVVK